MNHPIKAAIKSVLFAFKEALFYAYIFLFAYVYGSAFFTGEFNRPLLHLIIPMTLLFMLVNMTYSATFRRN